MLSPATLPEILGGKSLVSFILTCLTIVLCAKLTGYEPASFPLIIIAIIISSLFYLALGTLLGLLSRSVIEASVIMLPDRKSTRLNSSHVAISYAVFCLKKKKNN